MDFKKSRGGKRGEQRSSDKTFSASPDPGATIDARPTGEPPPLAKQAGGGPRNIQETKAWKESTSGLQRMWHNYLNMLGTQFRRMSRADQEALITRLCQIVTIGSAALVTMLFYGFIPLFLKIFVLPGILLAAYWAGTNVVAPIMIVRYEQYLNPQ
ncbi:MAG TPA: hypothetical protein V6D08_18150 [Candidatus Obscuribacterales bacterium]